MSSRSIAIVDDARVAYRVQGHGPAIVLVNGTSALDVHWGPIIEEFSKSRTVISLDYSGSGETTDDGGALSLKKLATQVVAVARAAGAARFDLVGYSLGAAIAIQLASGSPQLVRSLILVAGFASGTEPRLELQFRLWLDLVRHNRDAFTRLLVLSGLTPAFVSGAGSATIEAMINGYMSVANWDGIARQVELDLQVDVRAQARQLARPTLVIGCAHDQIVTTTRELADSIPGAAYREIAAGHLAYFEAAGEFMAVANDFLQQQPS
jgi:3-oxoadipate enol-lactonase